MNQTITIMYAAKKLENYTSAYKPLIWVNGKWVYTTMHAKKTRNGALKAAKKYADNIAEREQKASDYWKRNNTIIVKENEAVK